MAPEAGLSCCQPHSVEWHNSRSGAGGAVFLSGRSVERCNTHFVKEIKRRISFPLYVIFFNFIYHHM
jgi:hypothetical protein